MTSTERRLRRLAQWLQHSQCEPHVHNPNGWPTPASAAQRTRAIRLLLYWADRCDGVCPGCNGNGVDLGEPHISCGYCDGTGIANWGHG